MKRINTLFAAAAALTTLLAASCDNDRTLEFDDRDYDTNVVYVHQPAVTTYNISYSSATGQFLSGAFSTLDIAEVCTTHAAKSDIRVTLTVDVTELERRNAELLAATPEGVEANLWQLPQHITFAESSVTVPRGEYRSAEPIRIICTDLAAFIGEKQMKFLLPIKLTTSAGGVRTSVSKSMIVLEFVSSGV